MSLHYRGLAESLDHEGGFTVTLTGDHIRDGYAVSVHPEHERVLPLGPVSPFQLMRYADQVWSELGQPGSVFGAWRDPLTGHTYLDVTRVVRTHKAAYVLAAHHGQLAYFDLANGKTIHLDRPGLSVAA